MDLLFISNLFIKAYKDLKGKASIIGVGGIDSGKSAFEKIAAGATALQLYTGMVYGGPMVIKEIKKDLIKILNELKKDRSLNNKNLRSLVRFSGTEPLVRILVEGLDKNIVKKQSVKIKSIVRPHLG